MCSPLLTFLRKVDTALDAQVETPVFAMEEAELAEAPVLAHRVSARLDETELRLAHQASSRDADAKTVWVRATQQAPRVAAARLKLAAALDAREPMRAAMAAGDVSEDQMRVVVAALKALPADLGAELAVQAEAHLLELCTDHDPDQLRLLGRRLMEVLDPERAEADEAARVEAEYLRAIEKRRLDLRDRGDGTYAINGVVPSMHGHILQKLLAAWSSPKHRRACHGPDAGDQRLDAGQRRGRAFCELLERLGPDHVPYSGGVSARVVVGIDLDDLTARFSEHGVATLDGSVSIPAWEARSLACEAGIAPAILNGKSEVLDLCRTRRFHNEPQRVAIFKRDRTCRTEGFDWPAWMGHVHHPVPWSRGGPTDMTGMSLCPQHHARAHDPTYEMRTSKNGQVVFRRT